MPSASNPDPSSSNSATPDSLRNDPDAPARAAVDPTVGERRSILERWNLSVQELTELVDANPSLRGIMLG